MKSIHATVEAVVDASPMLRFGLGHGLLNLTQVARFIQPAVEAQARKSARIPAIVMGLSRIQQQLSGADVEEAAFRIDRMSVQAHLCALTLVKSPETHQQLSRLISRLMGREAYVTFTEGATEITAIIDESEVDAAASVLTTPPRRIDRRLAGIGIQIGSNDLTRPGLLYAILQQIALQGVSVVEVASTTSEFNVYLKESDVRLAFDSLYRRFVRR